MARSQNSRSRIARVATDYPTSLAGISEAGREFMKGDKIIKNYLIPVKRYFWGKTYYTEQDRTRTIKPPAQTDMLPSMVYIPFTVASGEKAVLIQAEAPLHHKPTDPRWLSSLNQLRGMAPIPAKLVSLQDPGGDSAHVALLFAERGYWLFATGH